MAKTAHPGITRRRFLNTAASMMAVAGVGRPYLSRASDRPLMTHGIQSGDVSADSAVIWARSDRAARFMVEVSPTDSFTDILGMVHADARPESDFTAKLLLENLPAGQELFYRARFEDLSFSSLLGEAQVGRFRTAPADRRSLSFVWSGDCAGQGWGIDESRGGMRTFATMLRNKPDFFIHCGDSIYADDSMRPEQTLPDGSIWRNIVTEEKSHSAHTLADFRGCHKYNLLDANVRAFYANVPLFAMWDDHEVTNDWIPADPLATGKAEIRMLQLAANGRRAFNEYKPLRPKPLDKARIYRKVAYGPMLDMFLLDMRSYRNATDIILGAEQVAWLKRELENSTATWKVIAADMPLGVINTDGPAFGDGAPQGRESEIADLLSFIKHAGVRNAVWITADQHYTAAHYYDPNKAVFQDFEPFWEFMSGPIHAGTWTPSGMDNTFGPQRLFHKACSAEQGDNLAPCFGLQFFGHVEIDGESEVMTVTLKDVEDNNLWFKAIEPDRKKLSRNIIPARS